MTRSIDLAIDDNPQLPDKRSSGVFPSAALDACFDRLNRLVQDVFDVPISLVSLTTTGQPSAEVFIGPPERNTFVDQTLLYHSVSRSAPRDYSVLKIGDGLTDVRPRAPLASPFGCFAVHMCVPIHQEGAVVGAPWVLEQKPRDRSAEDISQLTSFAALVDDEIELDRLLRSADRRMTDLSFAHARALQTSKAKSDFITSMKHEIAAPLTAILGYVDLLIWEKGATLKQTHYLENVLSACERLSPLTQDFQILSGIEARENTISEEPFALDAIVISVGSIVQLSAWGKGIDLYIDVDPSFPETLLGDKLRLHQVLLNLLTNALKFTCEGSVTLRAVRDSTNSDAVRFEVADAGTGIDPTQQSRKFQRFPQANSSVAATLGGLGLGLAISQTLVTSIGGTIGDESDPGQGTTFRFTVAFPGLPTSRKSAA